MPIWDVLMGFAILVVLGTCCQGVKDAERINKQTNELKSRS